MDPYSSQNLQKYIQHELCAYDQLKDLDVLMFYLPHTLATKNVLRLNINKVLSSNQENYNLFYA